MKLSRTVGYAISAMVKLAQAEDSHPIPCSQLAADGQMPERFLLQVLRRLVKRGLLQSVRGADGGYCLGRAPRRISMLEVIEAVDGPLTGSPSSNIRAGATHLRLHQALRKISATVRRELGDVKLAHLLPSPRPRGPRGKRRG
jgi:Rrf2 family protein